jgi:hypothetical protein
MTMKPEDMRLETPLEQSVRREAEAAETREEREADTLVADIDAYVGETDPASLPEAEAALNAWQIPSDPRDSGAGAGDNEDLEPIFSAGSEAEAAIVRGVLESQGIPTMLDGLPAPILGNVFQAGEDRWGDILVPAGQAQEARALIQSAQVPTELNNPAGMTPEEQGAEE